jgi:hypothetical protein
VRVEFPQVYLKVCADLLPKNVELDINIDALSATEALQAYRGILEIEDQRKRSKIIDVSPNAR